MGGAGSCVFTPLRGLAYFRVGGMGKPEAPPLDGERVAKTLPRSAINMHEALPLDGERVVETPARKAHV